MTAHPKGTCLTRIVATVGPASGSDDVLSGLLEAGVALVRLNFSHGSIDDHRAMLAALRRVEATFGRPVGTLADLPGPKIRVEGLAGEGISLEVGQEVRIGFGGGSSDGTVPRLACTYRGIANDAEPGHRVLIDDGAVRLLVVDRHGDDLRCTTLVGGPILPNKGINLPDSVVRADPITERDARFAAFAVEAGIDYVGMSFVQHEADVHRLRQILRDRAVDCGRAAPPAIIAKLERPNAIERIEAILDAADGIMVARGDLGVEMDLAKVPILQKRILAAARAAGKPAIVATQMLQSMIEQPTPTRAEVSDVANAILDGCDAVMLSGETAIGRWPVVTVETMVRIAREAETLLAERPISEGPPEWLVRQRDRVAAIGYGASRAARDLGAAAVVAWSDTGRTALLLSRFGFSIPIIALGCDMAALRRMRLYRGVEPLLVTECPLSFESFAARAEQALREQGLLEVGGRYLFISGDRFACDPPQAILSIRELADAGATSPRPESCT